MELQASGQPGYVLDTAQCARKRELDVAVEFATTPRQLQTLEGTVQVRVGDAIVTGLAGERWRVSADHFGTRYRPADKPGHFISRPNEVRALRLAEPCEVLLSDGVSRLRGEIGDWLVDYGDGSLGIIAAHLFDLTYELL